MSLVLDNQSQSMKEQLTDSDLIEIHVLSSFIPLLLKFDFSVAL